MWGAIASFVVWVALAAGILVLGWDEPLRYRFLSHEAVAAEEKALVPPPPPTPVPIPPDPHRLRTPPTDFGESRSPLDTTPRRPR